MLKSKQVPLEFQTKQTKFKKYHKLKPKISLISKTTRERGIFYCVNSVAAATVKQVVAVLKIVKPRMKSFSRKSRVRLAIVPDFILTKKPKDIRMGRGKGVPMERVANIKNGTPILKLKGLSSLAAESIYKECAPKTFTKVTICNTLK